MGSIYVLDRNIRMKVVTCYGAVVAIINITAPFPPVDVVKGALGITSRDEQQYLTECSTAATITYVY